MFEILVYLFETYYSANATPDQGTMTQHLCQAGFENDDISDALDWLKDLKLNEAERITVVGIQSANAVRIYSRGEQNKLSREARGFLSFLESAGMLTPALRELIIERAMVLDLEPVPLDQFKVIVLMVLWTRQGSLDSLILEELLPDDEARQVH
jgi:Smg protein